MKQPIIYTELTVEEFIAQTTYVAIDETHRIECTPTGYYYPEHLVNPEGWAYYQIGNRQKRFRSENAARKFLLTASK